MSNTMNHSEWPTIEEQSVAFAELQLGYSGVLAENDLLDKAKGNASDRYRGTINDSTFVTVNLSRIIFAQGDRYKMLGLTLQTPVLMRNGNTSLQGSLIPVVAFNLDTGENELQRNFTEDDAAVVMSVMRGLRRAMYTNMPDMAETLDHIVDRRDSSCSIAA